VYAYILENFRRVIPSRANCGALAISNKPTMLLDGSSTSSRGTGAAQVIGTRSARIATQWRRFMIQDILPTSRGWRRAIAAVRIGVM
jgi:hypothetical protein